ncbi:hypothetical protein [Lactiplantibacillus herbarum]|uniref:hypothetical protein n=1 Tax=Lactiplantibacillus herbarum TaxID=1670446 RepID=UPI00064F25A4|nr:hypothetical protein [Lactiplantibacillus herbarum]
MMKDIAAIERRVSELKGLDHMDRYIILSTIIYVVEGIVFTNTLTHLKNIFKGINVSILDVCIAFVVIIAVTIICLKKFKGKVIDNTEDIIDAFCDFLKKEHIYSRPLLIKYSLVEKNKIKKAIRQSNAILSMMGSITAILATAVSASILSKYQDTHYWSNFIMIGILIWVFMISTAPNVVAIWEHFFMLDSRRPNETFILLNEVETRFIKEESLHNVTKNIPSHHPRKGY